MTLPLKGWKKLLPSPWRLEKNYDPPPQNSSPTPPLNNDRSLNFITRLLFICSSKTLFTLDFPAKPTLVKSPYITCWSTDRSHNWTWSWFERKSCAFRNLDYNFHGPASILRLHSQNGDSHIFTSSYTTGLISCGWFVLFSQANEKSYNILYVIS